MKCNICRQQYERNSGPMIVVCTSCLNKPKEPDKYIKSGSLFLPTNNGK